MGVGVSRRDVNYHFKCFFKQKRNVKRKRNERLGSRTPHMELGKDAGSRVESFLEGKTRSAES